ncbi:tetratricopeptide repeat protein [Desulfobacterales bacterium HSG16]|nr:tetratricopeptide repeat protein [Desulfobacterales bacterium HSG16]
MKTGSFRIGPLSFRASLLFFSGLFLFVIFLSGCTSGRVKADQELFGENYEQAIPLYEEQIKNNTASIHTRNRLGFAYLKTENYKQAMRQFETVLRLLPDDPYATLYLGIACLKTGDLDKPLALWQQYKNKKVKPVVKAIEGLITFLRIMKNHKIARNVADQESELQFPVPAYNTFAVLNYEDLTVDGDLKSFRKGLSALIITYLSKIRSIKVIERIYLKSLIQELDFGQSGAVDPETAPRIGMLLGVENLVAGSLSGDIIATTSVISSSRRKVRASMANEVTKEEFYMLPILIVRDIVKALGIKLSAAEQAETEMPKTKNYKAFLYFGQALAAIDAGDWQTAQNLFEKALAEDPEFDLARIERDLCPDIEMPRIEEIRTESVQQISETVEKVVDKIVASQPEIEGNAKTSTTNENSTSSSNGTTSDNIIDNPEENMNVIEGVEEDIPKEKNTIEFEW